MNDMTEVRPALTWNADALWRHLQPVLPGISVEVAARLESTNSALIERARASAGQRDAPVTGPGDLDPLERRSTPLGRRSHDTQPCLLVAEQQTRGRGRMGRAWQSSAGASLTFSLGLPLAPVQWSGLSLAVGVALAQALDADAPPGAPRLLLKWPNDLWLADNMHPMGGRKLGGVLIETVPVGERRMCVVGVGLNIQPQFVKDVDTGFACVDELLPGASAPHSLALVAAPLLRALQDFERAGFAYFADDYRRRDLLAGRALTTTMADMPQGVGAGVDRDGALLVEANGRTHRIISGEASVRPAPEGEVV
jgi:BirA family biotin operon repressor/biotin-[acetyl-CoA-carboxylase] ligase